MARISIPARIKCDRCKCVFTEDAHHGLAILRADYGELTPGHGRTTGVYDLCDACERKVRRFIERAPEIYGEEAGA